MRVDRGNLSPVQTANISLASNWFICSFGWAQGPVELPSPHSRRCVKLGPFGEFLAASVFPEILPEFPTVMKGLLYVVLSILLTMICWGVYGPVLKLGQDAFSPS